MQSPRNATPHSSNDYPGRFADHRAMRADDRAEFEAECDYNDGVALLDTADYLINEITTLSKTVRGELDVQQHADSAAKELGEKVKSLRQLEEQVVAPDERDRIDEALEAADEILENPLGYWCGRCGWPAHKDGCEFACKAEMHPTWRTIELSCGLCNRKKPAITYSLAADDEEYGFDNPPCDSCSDKMRRTVRATRPHNPYSKEGLAAAAREAEAVR